MVWLQDEPISDPVCVPLYYVSKLAVREKVKVCQVGEGADELFIGVSILESVIFSTKVGRCQASETFEKTCQNLFKSNRKKHLMADGIP